MDKNFAGATAYASASSSRPAAFELEVYERAVTQRAVRGALCLVTGGFISGITTASGTGTASGTTPISGIATGLGVAPIPASRHSQIKSAVFTGMNDVQVSKPRTGYRAPRGTG